MSTWLILSPGAESERAVPVPGRLFVGRECAGIEPARRLIIDHPSVSRDHFELRSDPPTLIDVSTNGTFVNGRRVERGEPLALKDGDRIELGAIELELRSQVTADEASVANLTVRAPGVRQMAIVAGDVIGYTALTERHGAGPVARAMESVFGALRVLLEAHDGTVGNYVGDALLAAWDADRDADAAAKAMTFAVRAAGLVDLEAFTIEPQGAPIRLGWAVTLGEAATGIPARTREAIHGDPVNLAFRLAGLAGRDGKPSVLVSAEAAGAAPSAAEYQSLGEVSIRGRASPVEVLAAHLIK